jgi:hypothetical protein
MQRRTFLKLGTGAFVGAALAACGGAHDGSANLEPDPLPAPARVEAGMTEERAPNAPAPAT